MIITKQRYLLLTAALLLLSVGTGYTMQQRQLPEKMALQALETATIQLGRDTQLADAHRHKALDLVQQAMRELESESTQSP